MRAMGTESAETRVEAPGAKHRAAGVVGLAVVGSRIMGLVREQVFAAMFGAGRHLDAFLAAFQIPNLLRDLFAEGALSTAFTATFAKTHEKEGPEPAWGLTNLLVSALIVVMGAICLLGIAASPLIVQVTSFGFHQVPGKFELTVRLTRILFPFILVLSLAAVVMGVLNARYVFGLPASASTAFNIVSVVMGVGLACVMDPQKDWLHPAFSERALYGVSIGVLLGGLAQLGIQLPSLWRTGYRFRWRLDFRNERLRQVWRLAWPSMIAGAAVQVNVLVNGMFASEIDGARSWLNCAFRLMQFPIGVFGVAIATVTLPAVARLHARQDMRAVGRHVEESLRLAFFLTLPATAGLVALAPEVIGLIYEHGQFTAAATVRTAAALRAFAIGLCGYAGLKVIVPCFYALDRPRTPLMVSGLGMALNLGLNLVLVKLLHLGHVGLATTTGVLALVNFLQLAAYLRRDVRYGEAEHWARFLGSIAAASALCGFIAFGMAAALGRWVGGGVLSRGVVVLGAVGSGALSYWGAVHLLRVREARVLGALVRRLRGGGSLPARNED
jgi:putative peptidoglycan lipid II flippase